MLNAWLALRCAMYNVFFATSTNDNCVGSKTSNHVGEIARHSAQSSSDYMREVLEAGWEFTFYPCSGDFEIRYLLLSNHVPKVSRKVVAYLRPPKLPLRWTRATVEPDKMENAPPVVPLFTMAAKFDSEVPHDVQYRHMALGFLSTVPQ